MKANVLLFVVLLLLPLGLFFAIWAVFLVPLSIKHQKHPYTTYSPLNSNASSEITVNLETNILTNCTIYYYHATSKSIVKSLSDQAPCYLHSFPLANLAPGSIYHYTIACGNTATISTFPYTFNTFDNSSKMHFAIVGDTQINPTGVSHMPFVLSSIIKHSPEPGPIIHVGDVAHYPESKVLWDLFFHYAKPLLELKTLFTVSGNHDCTSATFNKCKYSSYFGAMDHHLLEYSNAIIIGLADYEEVPLKEWKNHTQWLGDTLEKYKDKPIKIIVGHRPHLGSYPVEVRTCLVEDYVGLFEKYKVTMLINGHQHMYRRFNFESQTLKQNMVNLVVGGGGGTIEPIIFWEDYKGLGYNAVLQAQNPAPSFATMDIFINNTIEVKVWSIYGSLIDCFRIVVNESGDVSYKAGLHYTHTNAVRIAVTPYIITISLSVGLVVLNIVYLIFACFFESHMFSPLKALSQNIDDCWNVTNSPYPPTHDYEVKYQILVPMELHHNFPIPFSQPTVKALLCKMILACVSAYYAMVLAFSLGSASGPLLIQQVYLALD
eukprot:TRINITY_DN2675_c0_g1_i1.p1 TRINITY_DN2675_c0_g1~~TRINITY_DN2675_c0_g1_i1.p1  ORF type:complete len:547 (+),score=15.85 TRINITY_DN2675_c0_g1_i1:141-1781(+)